MTLHRNRKSSRTVANVIVLIVHRYTYVQEGQNVMDVGRGVIVRSILGENSYTGFNATVSPYALYTGRKQVWTTIPCANYTGYWYMPDFPSQFSDSGEWKTCKPQPYDPPYVLKQAPFLTETITQTKSKDPGLTLMPSQPKATPDPPTQRPTPANPIPAPTPANPPPSGPVEDPGKVENPGQVGSGNTGSGQSGSGQSGSGQSGSGQTGSGQSGSGQSGSGQAGSGQSGTGQSGSGQSDSGNTGQSSSGSANSGSGNSGSGDSNPDNRGQADLNQGSSFNPGAGQANSNNNDDQGTSADHPADNPAAPANNPASSEPATTPPPPPPFHITSNLVLDGQTLRAGNGVATVAGKVISINTAGSVVVRPVATPGAQQQQQQQQGDAVPDGSSGSDGAVTLAMAYFSAAVGSVLGTSVPVKVATYMSPAPTGGSNGLAGSGSADQGQDGAVVTDIGQVIGGMGAYILSALGGSGGNGNGAVRGQTGMNAASTGVLQQSGSGSGSGSGGGRSGSGGRNGTVAFTGGASVSRSQRAVLGVAVMFVAPLVAAVLL